MGKAVILACTYRLQQAVLSPASIFGGNASWHPYGKLRVPAAVNIMREASNESQFTCYIIPSFVNSRQVIVMDQGHITVRRLLCGPCQDQLDVQAVKSLSKSSLLTLMMYSDST
jgi:hypothetical protein